MRRTKENTVRDHVITHSIEEFVMVCDCEHGVNAGGPLIGVSPQMRIWRRRYTSRVRSCGYTTITCTTLTPTHTRMNGILSEWGCDRCLVNIPDRLSKGRVVASRPG